MSLYQKYRPLSFDTVKGNQDIIEAIQKMISDENRPHSYLFIGPSGCGKTTLARILAKELECSEWDLKEVDIADYRGIDTIREIRQSAGSKPMNGPVRIWILDECHKLTTDAQNALLKILEDTPSHVYFILCTTDPQKLIDTLKGRCVTFQVTPLQENQMVGMLRKIARNEGESIDPSILELIARESLGRPRNAIQILEKIIAVSPEKRENMVLKAAEQESQLIELCRALLKKAAWKETRQILFGLKDKEAEEIRRAILGYCQAILLKEDNPMAGIIMDEMYEPFYNTGFPGLVFKCYSITKS